MTGKYYFLGKNGLEYATIDDAKKYGGGAVGQRFHNPIKKYEPIPYDPVDTTNLVENTDTVFPASVNVPQAISEYDNMEIIQLKEVLRNKGYVVKGNPKRETLIAKLKSL